MACELCGREAGKAWLNCHDAIYSAPVCWGRVACASLVCGYVRASCMMYVVRAGARAVGNVRYCESIGVRSLGEARASLRPRGECPPHHSHTHTILIQSAEDQGPSGNR